MQILKWLKFKIAPEYLHKMWNQLQFSCHIPSITRVHFDTCMKLRINLISFVSGLKTKISRRNIFLELWPHGWWKSIVGQKAEADIFNHVYIHFQFWKSGQVGAAAEGSFIHCLFLDKIFGQKRAQSAAKQMFFITTLFMYVLITKMHYSTYPFFFSLLFAAPIDRTINKQIK